MASFKKLAASILSATTAAYLRQHLPKNTASRSFERVCVVGAIWRKDGIARGAVLQYEAFRRLGVDAELVDVKGAGRRPFLHIDHRPGTVYIFHSGGPQLGSLIAAVLPEATNAYRIAYWAWELPIPPLGWPDSDALVSEIWTCSRFSKASLSSRWNCPVHVVSHVICATPSDAVRSEDTFNVLVVADSRSSVHRKNIQGSIQAFAMACRSNPCAVLTMKINGVVSDLSRWIEEADCPGQIHVIDRYLTDNEMSALYSSSDVLLSLHRAEGFGLHLLEAMARGTVVVATRWSGNLDFMTDNNSVLIDAETVRISDPTVYSGYKDGVWAAPDLGKASIALVLLLSNPKLRRDLASKGIESAQDLLKSWSYP